MFGNMLNNAQMLKLISDKLITIKPFNEQKLRLSHYPLTLNRLIWLGQINSKGQREIVKQHSFESGSDYEFAPNEYCVGEVQEFVHLSDGFVGHFVPTSIFIDLGFGLTAGKIDPGFGKIENKKQVLRFGIKNLTDRHNLLPSDVSVAHLTIFDLRGLNNSKISPQQLRDILTRFSRADDDGPRYDKE
jgi:deoxycytidine triphosphate deaminase